MSTLEKLFRRETTVELPGIGTATIRNLSERDHNALYDGLDSDDPDMDLWARRLVSLCVVALDGEPVEITVEQTHEIDLVAFRMLSRVAAEHCGFGGEDNSGNSHPANGTSGD